MRRLVALLAIAVGVGLITFPLAYSLFDRTAEAERILDRFEFLTLEGNPARYLDEAETTRRGSSELVEQAIPRLASQAGESRASLARRYPALANARVQVPAAEGFSIRYSEQLDAVKGKFKSVYDIPVAGLPLTATPWLFLIAGLACVIAGLAALRTAGRAALAAILALGLAMAVGPLALGAVAKSADGEDVKDFATRGLTERAASAAEQASAALDALVKETDQRILPELARRQGASTGDLDRQLGSEFPNAHRFLAEWGGIGPRLARLADAVSASVKGFESAKKMPIAAPVWLLLAAGAALALSAAAALSRGSAGWR